MIAALQEKIVNVDLTKFPQIHVDELQALLFKYCQAFGLDQGTGSNLPPFKAVKNLFHTEANWFTPRKVASTTYPTIGDAGIFKRVCDPVYLPGSRCS